MFHRCNKASRLWIGNGDGGKTNRFGLLMYLAKSCKKRPNSEEYWRNIIKRITN